MITLEQYNAALLIVKQYDRQEYLKLPYQLGHVIDGTKWSHAKRMKDTGKILVPVLVKYGGPREWLELIEPRFNKIARTFKEE